MFNETFFRFFFAFILIVALAFGVLIVSGSKATPNPVDNVAVPQ